MSIISPLTINTDIAHVNSASSRFTFANTEARSNYNELTSDTVSISTLGIDLLHKSIEKGNNESVRISSTIGKNKSANNLNHEQAKELYSKIASLI